MQDLNLQFPQAGFSGKVQIAPGTEKPRASTGLELQVLLPVVNAPFRVYFAYNPLRVRGEFTTAHRGGPRILPERRDIL